MKIALIDPSLFTWPYDEALAQGLRAGKNEVAIFGKWLGRPEDPKLTEGLHQHFYRGLQQPLFSSLPRPVFLFAKGLSHIGSMAGLIGVLRRWQPDVIHFQWAPLPAIDRWFIDSFRRIAPTVLTVHDSTPFNGNPRSILQSLGAQDILHRFDHLIVHTETALHRLESYGVAPEKISRVPHGPLGAMRKVGIAERPRSTPPGIVTFLLFGKIKPYKGADLLLRALAALPDSVRKSCMVRIVGKPYMDMEPLFALAAELGVSESVEFALRFVPDDELAALVDDSDVMIMPYREIDASGVLMVALSMHKPVVASRVGLFAEMIEDGRHGFLVPIEDVAALAQAMQRMITDNDLRAAMTAEVALLDAAMPEWPAIARETERVYALAAESRVTQFGSEKPTNERPDERLRLAPKR